jgi:hypothetical protein
MSEEEVDQETSVEAGGKQKCIIFSNISTLEDGNDIFFRNVSCFSADSVL